MELVAGVNLIQRDIKGVGALFLPEGVEHFRGVIVVIGWGRGFEAYADPALGRLAKTLDFGLMRTSIYHVMEPHASSIGPGRIPAADAAEALVLLMRRFAEESGRQELASAPFLSWGHSAAGGLISGLAATLPQRTIGFVRYHSGPQASGDLKVLSQIRALLMIGALDPGNSVEAATLSRSGTSSWCTVDVCCRTQCHA